MYRSIESPELSMLAKVLDDYCIEAGIPEGHPARENFGRRLMTLYLTGINDPAVLKSKMNDGYDEWLGEVGEPNYFIPPETSAEDSLAGNNILPGSDRRGKAEPADG